MRFNKCQEGKRQHICFIFSQKGVQLNQQVLQVSQMTSQMKKKHSHKRSSSMMQCPQVMMTEEKITAIPCQIASSETLQLIKASQQRNQFQIIVDSFDQEPPSFIDQDICNQVEQRPSHRSNRQTIFSEYFQIQQVHSLKRQDSAKNTLISDENLWQDLHSQPRTNGRLRYHRNNQEKVFTVSCQKMNLLKGLRNASFEGICCNV